MAILPDKFIQFVGVHRYMTIEADMFRRMAFEDSIYSSSNDPWKYIDPVTMFVGDHYIFCFCMLVVISLVIYRLKSDKWFFQ